jgi:hypothetical protein
MGLGIYLRVVQNRLPNITLTLGELGTKYIGPIKLSLQIHYKIQHKIQTVLTSTTYVSFKHILFRTSI